MTESELAESSGEFLVEVGEARPPRVEKYRGYDRIRTRSWWCFASRDCEVQRHSSRKVCWRWWSSASRKCEVQCHSKIRGLRASWWASSGSWPSWPREIWHVQRRRYTGRIWGKAAATLFCPLGPPWGGLEWGGELLGRLRDVGESEKDDWAVIARWLSAHGHLNDGCRAGSSVDGSSGGLILWHR